MVKIPCVKILDNNLRFLNEIDDIISIDFRRSWQGVGDFSLVICGMHTGIKEGNIIMLGNNGHRCGIIRKTVPVASEKGTIITVTGQTLNGYVNRYGEVKSNDVSFFLIDFKGGGMANLFLKLPHLIGSISNLAGNQIRRAMISIKSENRRRQTLFNEYGVNNIDAYTRLYKNGETKIPIPHLVIIIDEFAEMKRSGSEEYINELISVAQIGRSLGVHLILATQKPSGTVSDNIWSNTKFKLCLRVQDRKDISEMLHKPDAAYITQAGRCYLQVGNDELYELFQSGWSGAVYDPDSTKKNSIATMITSLGKTAVVGNYTKLKRMEYDKKKWFSAVLSALGRAANSIIGADDFSFIKTIRQSAGRSEDICRLAALNLKEQGYNFEGNDVDISCLNNFMNMIPVQTATISENTDDIVEKIIIEQRANSTRMPELKEKTQLEAVVEYIAEVAKEKGYSRQKSLWLPALPGRILLSEIESSYPEFDGKCWFEGENGSLEALFGMYDDPENQAQLPTTVDLAESGHIALCGSVTSGKSTFLQTFCFSLMKRYSPSKINFYFLDFSSNMLSCFEGFPHVGGVINANMLDKTDKFFNMLQKIMEERKHRFGGGNYAQYVKSTGEKIPVIAVVIDNYAVFRDKTSNKYEADLVRLSREGLSYGLYLIASSAGFGISEIPNRIGENMKTVIALDMGDKYKFAEVFRNVRPTVLPDNDFKGRGLFMVGGSLLEFQTAIAVDAKDDYERNDIIHTVGVEMSGVWKGRTAAAIPFIPENPVLSDLKASEEYCRLADENKDILPFGYQLQDASICGIDLRNTFCYTILGKRQSGKSNLLKIMIYSAFRANGSIMIYEKSSEYLKGMASQIKASYVSTDIELFEYIRDVLIPEFIKRNKLKKECQSNGLTETEIYDEISKEKPIFVFADNLKDLFESAQRPSGGITDMTPTLENLLSKGRLHNIYFIGCMNIEDYGIISALKLYNTFTGYKKGILVGSAVNSQRIFNFRNIHYNETSKQLRKNQGLYVCDEDENIGVSAVIPLVRRDEF